MDGKHRVVTCFLSPSDQEIQTYAQIDCGATGYAFVDEDFARHHQLPLHPLKNPRTLEVIDGRQISSGDITHIAEVQLSIQEHHEKLPMFITKLGHYPIVLGIPWLKQHDVAIIFTSNVVTFGS
jgi:predicted aspartyl protease